MAVKLSEVLALIKELSDGSATDERLVEIVARMELDTPQLRMIHKAASERPILRAALEKRIARKS